MQSIKNKTARIGLKITTIFFMISSVIFSSHAHLMVAQQGTLNIVDSNAFVVISLPISAFEGLDANQDGQISMIEFNLNRNAVSQEIADKLMLVNKDKSRQLIDILLSPVQDHHSVDDHFTQLTVMGRFNLEDFPNTFKLKADLFGKTVEEQVLKITMIRAKDKLKQIIQLTPKFPTAELLLIHLK
jgi:hypothetical protein